MSKTIKALIVEDTPIAMIAAKMNLEKAGCTVEVAASGEIAIEMCNNNSYDIIFMDIGLGTTDGFAVTKEIRKLESYKNTPIVALTAHGEEEYRRKAKEVGMNSFLNKPIEFSKIEEVIKKLVVS